MSNLGINHRFLAMIERRLGCDLLNALRVGFAQRKSDYTHPVDEDAGIWRFRESCTEGEFPCKVEASLKSRLKIALEV
jgi:hypothetical protein